MTVKEFNQDVLPFYIHAIRTTIKCVLNYAEEVIDG